MFRRRLTRGQMGWTMVLEIIWRFDSQTSSVFCFASQSARWSWKYRTGEASPCFSFSDAQSSPDSSECSLHSGCIWTRVRSANYNSMPNHHIPPIEKPTQTGHIGIWVGSTNGDAAGVNSFRLLFSSLNVQSSCDSSGSTWKCKLHTDSWIGRKYGNMKEAQFASCLSTLTFSAWLFHPIDETHLVSFLSDGSFETWWRWWCWCCSAEH